jgi:molybdenum ABC transporter molybdate-binding protein
MTSPEPISAFPVYAAGSLRAALSQVAQDYRAHTGQAVELSFGASGLLRERLEKGEPAQVFASADTEQPQRLAAGGAWQTPTVFVRNSLCALTSAHIQTTPETLLQTLLHQSAGSTARRATPEGGGSARRAASGRGLWLDRAEDGVAAGTGLCPCTTGACSTAGVQPVRI